jgi:hypothetical protein
MPEGRAGTVWDALFALAARRVRLLTVIVLFAGVSLIAAQDASWTSVALVGIAVLMIAVGGLGLRIGLRAFRTTRGARGSE